MIYAHHMLAEYAIDGQQPVVNFDQCIGVPLLTLLDAVDVYQVSNLRVCVCVCVCFEVCMGRMS